MIAGSILKLGVQNISSESLIYFLNSYGCQIQNTYTFNDMIINHSNDIQCLINKNIHCELKRYTEINNIIQILESQGNIELIENATQQQINNISTNYEKFKVQYKKRKKIFSKKKKKKLLHFLPAKKYLTIQNSKFH